MSDHLNQLANCAPVTREVYGNDPDNKPNDHCVWQRELPTVNSGMAWVETDAHFRERVKEKINDPK